MAKHHAYMMRILKLMSDEKQKMIYTDIDVLAKAGDEKKIGMNGF